VSVILLANLGGFGTEVFHSFDVASCAVKDTVPLPVDTPYTDIEVLNFTDGVANLVQQRTVIQPRRGYIRIATDEIGGI